MRELCVAAIFLTVLSSSVPAMAAEDCRLKQMASLPFSDTRPDMAVVEISVAGRPLHFLVDTGGIYSEIFRDEADALGLDLSSITGLEIYSTDGSIATHFAKAHDVKIGPVNIQNLAMIVSDRPAGERGFDGILAPDVLAMFDLDFDFADRKLNLMSPDHCDGKVVYWTGVYSAVDFKKRDNQIDLSVNLDGHDLSAVLDTGSSYTNLFQNVSESAFGLSASSPGMVADPKADPDDLGRMTYRFNALTIGELAVKNPLVHILQNAAQESFEKKHNDPIGRDSFMREGFQTGDMLLGMNVLTKLHLYIAYKERKIYVTAADAH
jgi:predicted aspartyl protease